MNFRGSAKRKHWGFCLFLASAGLAIAQPPVQRMVNINNEGVTGTTLNKLAKLTGAPSTAIVTTAGDTGGALGIVIAGAGTTGQATIQEAGEVACVFDGATTAGHYVQISATTNGACHDAGGAFPTSGGQVLGVVVTTNGGAGTYSIDMALRQATAAPSGSGTVSPGTANQLAYYAGTGSTVSGTNALPNGTTATTQSVGDASGDVASDQFLAQALASINPALNVQAATIAALSNTPTYNNGTGGVGATLTASSNGALTIDGYAVQLNDRVLVKNQASAFQNGFYVMTTLGDGSHAYVLTRASDYNVPANINYTGSALVLQGSTLNGQSWHGPTNIVTVGTDAINFAQDPTPAATPSSGNVKKTGNLNANAIVIGAGGNTVQAGSAVNCPDSGGNHLNISSSTGVISCGTTSSTTVVHAIGATFDGGGSALTTGTKVYYFVPYGCTINAWNMTVDTGTATIDVWKIASGTAIPTIANTITASATPAISSNTALHSTTLTGWTTTVTANDIFAFDITAVSSATRASLVLQCQ